MFMDYSVCIALVRGYVLYVYLLAMTLAPSYMHSFVSYCLLRRHPNKLYITCRKL